MKSSLFKISSRSKEIRPHLGLTCGDTRGIGYEIAFKALIELHTLNKPIQSDVLVFSAGPSCHLEKALQMKLSKVLGKQFLSIHEDFFFNSINISKKKSWGNFSNYRVIEIISKKNPVEWVEEATKLCLQGQLQGLVTGPLSKVTIKAAGKKDLGHNDIFKRLTGIKKTYMAFLGPKLQISLLTGHIPLKKVPAEIEKSVKNDEISQLIQWSHLLFNSLCLTTPPSKKTKRHQQTKQPKPLALLGLNPHAGDQGLIGTEEIAWLKKTRHLGTKLMGPLPPDTAFSEEIRRKVCGYLCLYHDQGLIPFKLLHGFNEGCQISLGLPFWRTSVDHGPAFDLYAKNLAQHGSMLEALKTCEVLVNKVKLLK